MLDRHRGGLVELLEQLERGVRVHDVVVRQGLALQLDGIGDARLVDRGRAIESRGLVRVLAVPQVLGFGVLQVQRLAERLPAAVRVETAQIVGDGRVVARGQPERLFRQRQLEVVRQAPVGFQRFQHRGVIVRVHHHADVGVVLGRGAQQRRAADVDVLDRVGKAAILSRHGLLERV